MPVEDDQTRHRSIFSKDPTFVNVTTYPNAGTAHTVVQSDPTKLLCRTTPDPTTPQKVVNALPADLKVLNTPDGTNPQPVKMDNGIVGIWPPEGSTRVHGDAVQSGSGSAIVYTVPANNKLYIHSAQITAQASADGDVNGRMGVRDDTDTFQFYIFYLYINIKGFSALSESFSPALEALAGWDIYMLTTHATVAVRGLFHGWLEEA